MSRRQCSRSGCAERAVVSLTYEYAPLVRLARSSFQPSGTPTRTTCAGATPRRLSVPLGWKLSDRRDSPFCRLESTGTEQF